MRVSPCIVFPRTHIPRDACFPAHILLMSYVLQVIVIRVSPGIMFPHHRCADLHRTVRWLAIAIAIRIYSYDMHACMPIYSYVAIAI